MARGFTLMEMVIAIILLGIVGLFLGNVAGQAMGIAATSSSREALIQQGRFITERLSREIREAVPNSVIVENNCIEFLPIINSGIYSQLANNTNQLKFLPLKKQNLLQGDRLVVFPTQAQPLRQSLSDSDTPRQVAQLKSNVSIANENREEIEVELTRETLFPLQSPARRVYLYRDPVAYCYISSEQRIYRYQGYPLTRSQLAPAQLGSGVLMAENISRANFVVDVASLQRNGLIKIELTFADRGEEVRFDHDALIYNTP